MIIYVNYVYQKGTANGTTNVLEINKLQKFMAQVKGTSKSNFE